MPNKIEHSNMPLTTNSMVVVLVQNSTDYNNNCMEQCSGIAQYIFSLEGIIIILHMGSMRKLRRDNVILCVLVAIVLFLR